MKNNQKILQLHPHQSKLIDSLCFQLSVNIPDDNSLSLLDVLAMRKNNEITKQQCKELYREWLQSKGIYDIFTAKQVKIYCKEQLVKSKILEEHLSKDTINTYLQLLHDLYDELYKDKKKGQVQLKVIQEIQSIFSYLDNDGNIHLRLSQLFFLNIAFMIYQNIPIPSNYDQFKSYFKNKNKQFCEINGMISLRWFKNYFLMKNHQEQTKYIMQILKDIQRVIKVPGEKDKKVIINGLPNIIQQTFIRWRGNSKFFRLFQSKKKKLEIYFRVFQENEEIFFFNGGKEENILSQNFFIKKYGQQFVKALEIDNSMLRQFGEIAKELLNQYLSLISKYIQPHNINIKHHRSNVVNTSSYYLGSSKQNNSLFPNTSLLQYSNNPNQKKNANKSSQLIGKCSHNKSDININRQKTPTKNASNNIKGNQTKRFTNITPSNKKSKHSPLLQKQFGSTEKYISNNKTHLTPTKSANGGYNGSLYMGNTQQIYKNSKKQGLQKDSFYQKLFFFRNKRVESFDIVIKRLKGK